MTVLSLSSERVRCILPWQATVGECPVWSGEEKRLYWIDIQGQKVHRFDPSTGHNESFHLPEIVTAIGLHASGGLIVTLKKEFALFHPADQSLQRLVGFELDLPGNRFNDAKCDPAGRFWAGTMDATNWSAPAGSLYRLDAERVCTRMQTQVVCANGSGWSPDGRTMYFTESFRYAIFAYDFDVATGAISGRRTFVTLDRDKGGFPDGMTVDAEVGVWSNIVGLGQIRRYDPEGKLERMVTLPVSRATDCTFGGPDLDTLYVTTARETLTPEELSAAPLSGSLFAVDCGVRGLPSTPFAG
jgi:sugar lactone lactonase YvrE